MTTPVQHCTFVDSVLQLWKAQKFNLYGIIMSIDVSVVIAAEKKKRALQRSLDALVRQTLEKNLFEVLVVSDGDNEEIKDLVLAYRLYSFKYLHTAEGSGIAAAYNLGWNSAAGRMIAFTRENCLPHPNWLRAFLDNTPGELAFAFSGKVKSKNGLEERSSVSIQSRNSAFSRATLEIINGFDNRYTTPSECDLDIELCLTEQAVPVHYIPEALVVDVTVKNLLPDTVRQQRQSMYHALLYKKFPGLYRKKIGTAGNRASYVMTLSFLVLLITLGKRELWGSVITGIIYTSFFTYSVMKRVSWLQVKKIHFGKLMIISFLLPFVTVYWRLYGACKYRVFFL